MSTESIKDGAWQDKTNEILCPVEPMSSNVEKNSIEPAMNTSNINQDSTWQDITKEFFGSVKQLNLGELLKKEHFTLLEAMGAIELMDPKMDGGMMLKKSTRKILTFEQSIKLGVVKINHLELNEIIGIIDETYSNLATWLEGHSLHQTIMTNLYLHEPERIEDRSLRIFSQATLKIVDFMDALIHAVFCIEEEDFFLNIGKFNLARQISDQKVLNSLEDLCQHHEKLLAEKNQPSTIQNNSSNSKSNNKHNIDGTDPQQPEGQQQQSKNCNHHSNEHDKSLLVALISRLRFTYNFYAAFLSIYRNLIKGTSLDLSHLTDAQLMKTTKLVQNSTLACDQHLEKCLTYLDKWEETIDLGIKPKQAASTSDEIDYPTIMGFEPLINHKLLPPAYPRCCPIKSRPFTVKYLRNLILKLRKCLSISNAFTHKSFDKSLDLIEHFSKYYQPKSCVVSRSLLQCLYLPNRSPKLLKDELSQSLSDYCDPLLQPMKKDEVLSSALEDLLNDASKVFSQFINIYGHNRARQHEKFHELILLFKNLQYSTLLLAFKSSIVYSWITFHLTRLCIKYVLSGLELELFSPYEYPYVFWYLYDVLYRNEKEHLEFAKQSIYESQMTLEDNLKKTKGKKQRKKNQFTTSYHDHGILCNDAFRFLTGGLFLLTYGLRLQGKIKSPLLEFTSEEICFDHRFATLTVHSVYQSYRKTLSRLEKLEYIYREALDCFSEAKELFQTIGRHEDCLKVCKTNMVVAKILSSDMNLFTDREVEFCFDTHPCFPTVKV